MDTKGDLHVSRRLLVASITLYLMYVFGFHIERISGHETPKIKFYSV